MAKWFSIVPLNVSFRRALGGQNLILWNNLVSRLLQVQLSEGKDLIRWNLNSTGVFTVQSMYRVVINNGNVFRHKLIWSLKLPPKIKNFLWYLVKGVVLTKENLLKSNWQGNKKCAFCDSNETIQHLFINYHYAHFMWRLLFCCFGLPSPRSIKHMFGSWMLGVNLMTKKLILTVVSVLCWAIWTCRNDLIFDKKKSFTYL
jgi:hypothetical protein